MALKHLLDCFRPPSPRQTCEDDQLGRHVPRHFKFLKKLGAGTYGRVYLVERYADGKLYALKQTVMTGLEEPHRWVAVNEIRLLSSLDPHPHVVTCKEGFLDGQNLCIVMEYCKGGELAHIIKRHAECYKLLPEADVMAYFIQAALGLQYLHAHGILHRDIKPANILVGAGNRLKIADLGISQVFRGGDGSSKAQIGTPHYMAPEMWRRDPYSFPTDVWALGCVLHEMCWGSPLFLARSDQEIERRVLAGVVPPISKRYSQGLQDLIVAMLQYRAADRPSMDEVVANPLVQSRIALLAEESFASMKGLDRAESLSKILDPIEIPADLAQLNHRLPPPRYSIGDGLLPLLRSESVQSQPPQLASMSSGELSHKGSGAISVADTAYESGMHKSELYCAGSASTAFGVRAA